MNTKTIKNLLAITGFYLLTGGEIYAQNAPITFEYDFTSGTEGWVGDFADYPVTDSASYNLEFVHEALPSEIDANQNALRISGDNRSDDLFLFIKKKITGLEPLTEYKLVFDLEIASDGGTNTPGIGGAKGLSEYLKVGATGFEPKKVVTSPNFYEMNLDKSNQSQSGTDMVAIGTIAVHEEMDDSLFRLISRGNAHAPFMVKTNASGEAWVIVGTDSGFEGFNIVYYNRIHVSFTKTNSAPCASKGLNTMYEWIDEIRLGTLHNTSGNDGGYGDFTETHLTLSTNEVYHPTFIPGFSQSSYLENWKIWIDFNKDGMFDDSTEIIFMASGNGMITGFMGLPATAQAGETTMRVSMRYEGEPFSCGSFLYGEVEDYSVTIIDPAPEYCEASGQDASGLWIESFNINNHLSNVSGNDNGYADFTNIGTTVKPGYPFYLLGGNGYVDSPSAMYWTVYADWNQDGNFNGTHELIYQTEGGLETERGHFNVPGEASEGNTRIRVVASASEPVNGCTDVASGEIEDYTVFVNLSGLSSSSNPVVTAIHGRKQPVNKVGKAGEREIQIAPSPAYAYTQVQVTRPFEGGFQLKVYDVNGKVVFENQYAENATTTLDLDVSNLPGGQYHVNVVPKTGLKDMVYTKSFEVVK